MKSPGIIFLLQTTATTQIDESVFDHLRRYFPTTETRANFLKRRTLIVTAVLKKELDPFRGWEVTKSRFEYDLEQSKRFHPVVVLLLLHVKGGVMEREVAAIFVRKG